MNTQKIYNLIILDASGSMSSIYTQALTGVNETIATIRMAQEQHPDLEQYLTLASFSAGENFINRIYTAVPIAEVRDITEKDYPLLGCTALYDAMGTTISELQQKLSHDDRVLVTIITDGYENASRTWSGTSAAYARLMKNGCLHISDSRLRQTVCSVSQAILNLPKVLLAMNIMSLILGRGFGCVKRVGQSNAGWRKKSGNLRLNAVRNLPQDLPRKVLLSASWISFLLQRTKIFVNPLPLRKT